MKQLVLFLLIALVKANAYDKSAVMIKYFKMLKEYGVHHPAEIADWSDTLPSGDRIALDNKYYKIAYPKCFTVDVPVDEDNLGPKAVLNSMSLDFTSKGKCKYNGYEDTKNYALFVMYGYPAGFKNRKCNPKSMFYCQFLRINKNQALAYASIRFPEKDSNTHRPYIDWELEVFCDGKNKESYIARTSSKVEPDLETYLKIRDFKPPEYFKQIMSTFQCRKDR